MSRQLLLTVLAVLVPVPALAAAAPGEEARFLAAARDAFATRDPAILVKLTCWDRTPDADRKALEKVYADLVAERTVTFDLSLSDPDPAAVAARNKEPLPPNLPITRQLALKATDARDKRRIVFGLTFGVGEKDKRLFLTSIAPAQ